MRSTDQTEIMYLCKTPNCGFKKNRKKNPVSLTIVPNCQIKGAMSHAVIPNHIWEGWVCEIMGSGVGFHRQRSLKMCWVSMRKDFRAAFRLKSQEHCICLIEFHQRWCHPSPERLLIWCWSLWMGRYIYSDAIFVCQPIFKPPLTVALSQAHLHLPPLNSTYKGW